MKPDQHTESIHSIYFLKAVLEDNIKMITDIYGKVDDKSETFLQSLLAFKKAILTSINENGAPSSKYVSTPSIKNYDLSYNDLMTHKDNKVSMLQYINEIENKQFDFIKDIGNSNTIPDDLSDTFDNIKQKYSSLVDSLNRSVKTNQMNPVVY